MSEIQVVFGWMCPNCKDHGIDFDERVWRYCRFCGSKLQVEEAPADPEIYMKKS